MALDPVPWFIGGGQATHSADVARLLAYAAFKGRDGIVGPTDLAVTQTPTPSGKVRVHIGACSILSRYTGDQQQCYVGRNPQATDVDVPATDSGGPRYDMLTVRVRDPYPIGSADPTPVDPTVGPYIEFDLITDIEQYITGGLSPDGVESISDLDFDTPRSAFGLAVIRVPTLTSTITNTMIRDIRPMIEERSLIETRTQVGGTTTGGEWDEAGNITDYFEHWPQHAWPIRVPEWATAAVVKGTWTMPFLEPTGSVAGTSDARGNVRIQFDDGAGNLMHTTPTVYNFNQTSPTNGYRPTIIHSRAIDYIPPIIRGKNVTINMQVKGEAGLAGRLRADDGSCYFVDVTWLEKPSPPAS